MKPFWVYMLRAGDGAYYVGHTDDLERRISQHESGALPGFTSRRKPLQLVWSMETGTRQEALDRELQVKSWSRAKKEALIRGDWHAVKLAARGPDRESRPRPSTSAVPRQARDGLRSGRTDLHRAERTGPRPSARTEPPPRDP